MCIGWLIAEASATMKVVHNSDDALTTLHLGNLTVFVTVHAVQSSIR